MSRAQSVVDFPRHETMTATAFKMPRLSKSSFETSLAQVKPMFEEWLTADGIFQQNTLTVAKAVTQCWDLYKAEDKAATKVKFVRYFDTTISPEARMRDLMSNKTYNRITYLLNKVAVRTPNAAPAVSAAKRNKQREEAMRRCWKTFQKQTAGKPVPQEDVQTLVEKMLSILFRPAVIERVLAA